MNSIALATAIIVGLVVAIPMFKLFFGDFSEFWDCFLYSITPDIFSLFKGEYFEDMAKSFKLTCFFAIVGFAAYLTYAGVHHEMQKDEGKTPSPLEAPQ